MDKIITVKDFLKIVHWISIISICFLVLVLVFWYFIPLEFANTHRESHYSAICFLGFVIAGIVFILTRKIERKHTSNLIVVKIVLVFCFLILSFFVMMEVGFNNLCSWTTNKVLFENKQNHSIKIVQRSFGCGATDSSYPIIKEFQIKEFTSDFVLITEIDTNQINKNEWVRIENR